MSTTITDKADTAETNPLATNLTEDLRFLADLVETKPELAPHLAQAVAQLHIVLELSSNTAPGDIAGALVEAGGTAVATDDEDRWFPSVTTAAPHGTIRVTTMRLATPPEVRPSPTPRTPPAVGRIDPASLADTPKAE